MINEERQEESSSVSGESEYEDGAEGDMNEGLEVANHEEVEVDINNIGMHMNHSRNSDSTSSLSSSSRSHCSSSVHSDSHSSGSDCGSDSDHVDFSSDSENAEEDCSDSDNEPLYEGSDISAKEGLLGVLELYIQEKWTKKSLHKNITLLKKLLPKPNEIPSSGDAALAYLDKITPTLREIEHIYCSKCYFIIKEGENKCGHNSEEKFYEFPINEQIKYMFENRGLADIIDNNRNGNGSEGNMCDITDGSLYKGVKENMNGKYDLVLLGYTDGVNMSKSSKQELWAILGTISEVPPRLRGSFMVVCAVIVGQKENNEMMNMFFKPFVTSLQKLNQDGMSWVHPRSKETFCTKATSPMLCADAPAKALVLQHQRFNSKYGCNTCEQKTVLVELTAAEIAENAHQPNPRKRKKRKRRFVYQDDTNPAPLRTAERMDHQAAEAERNGKPCKGVLGHANVTNIPYFNRALCACAEYMHLVLLGVVKYLLSKIFFEKGPWYIGDKVHDINDFIANIKVPDFIKRSPRGLTDFKFWKASEFLHFLLFYSLPLFKDLLPKEYYQHWMLLVASLHIFLQEHISNDELQAAELMMKDFVRDIGKLYGDACYTYNVHNLLHIGLLVRRMGPLWGTSAFVFESFNGFMASIVHGTKHLGKELIRNIKIAQQVALLNSIVHANKNDFYNIPDAPTVELLGKPLDLLNLSGEEIHILLKEQMVDCQLYNRVKVRSSVFYTSKLYDSNKRRSNSLVRFESYNSMPAGYGEIIVFIKRENKSVCCLLKCFKILHVNLFVHEKTTFVVKNLIPIDNSDDLLIVPIELISMKMLRMGSCLGKTPNLVEVNL